MDKVINVWNYINYILNFAHYCLNLNINTERRNFIVQNKSDYGLFGKNEEKLDYHFFSNQLICMEDKKGQDNNK